jgi:hypothetical protein
MTGHLAARAVALLCVLCGFSGCALNNHFSDDAVQYNKEAELAQDKVILLNILRADYRRPFVFSGVQTVSGAASASGQLGLTIPLIQNGSHTGAVLSPTISRSAGPTATVGVVDTQEFYEGLLAPMPAKLVDYYVQRGFQKMMLFDLVFSRIDVKQDHKLVTTYRNDVRDTSFADFQTFLQKLVDSDHLTTVEPDKPKTFGPLLTAAELLGQPDYAAKAAAAGLDIKEVGWCDLKDPERALALRRLGFSADAAQIAADCDPGLTPDAQQTKLLTLPREVPLVLYRTQKANTDYRLCFGASAHDANIPACDVPDKSAAGAASNQYAAFAFPVVTPATKNCTVAGVAVDCGKPVEFDFVSRSPYGIIYYLGEIVRLNGQDCGAPPYTPETFVKNDVLKPGCLFNVQRNATDNDTRFLSVDYNGTSYSVADDNGLAFEIMDIVAELVALNKSAKDLPATNVITAISTP